MRYSVLLAGLLAAATALPAAAQERDVSRRLFTFLNHSLTVEVQSETPGSLQIVRGEPGVLDVAARVPGGVSTAALGGRDDALRLTAVGGEKVDFVVSVPEDAYVRVRLPNKLGTEVGSTRRGGSFSWPSGEETTNAAPVSGVSASRSLPPSGPLIAYAAESAPRVLNIPTLTTVRTVRVRVADADFEVGGNRPMSVSRGLSGSLQLHTSDDIQDIVMTVPSATRDFTLMLGGRNALTIRGREITAVCEPVTEQKVGTVRWFTFSPEAGLLNCR